MFIEFLNTNSNQHGMVSTVMWRPYLVSELSISFKVFGGCTFTLVSYIYVQRMAIRVGMTIYSITL